MGCDVSANDDFNSNGYFKFRSEISVFLKYMCVMDFTLSVANDSEK